MKPTLTVKEGVLTVDLTTMAGKKLSTGWFDEMWQSLYIGGMQEEADTMALAIEALKKDPMSVHLELGETLTLHVEEG